MNRTELEFQAEEQLQGESGLWAAVLMDLLADYRNEKSRDHDQALRIIHDNQYPLPLIAAVLKVDAEELRRRILRAMRGKGRTASQDGAGGAIRRGDGSEHGRNTD